MTMVRWSVRPAALALAAIFALGACGFAGTQSTNAPQNAVANQGECGKSTRNIKNADGSVATIKGSPSRVVALELSYVDALSTIGVTPVGIADDNDATRIIPPVRARIGTYTSVGLRQSPNLEIVSSLKPDLIIADPVRDKDVLGQLPNIAPTVILPSLQETYQQDLDSMTVIGQAMDQCTKMQARIDQHKKLMKDLATKVPSSETRKFLFAVTWDKGFNAHNSEAYTPGVLQALGLKSALQGTPGNPYNDMTLETLVAANPQIMFIAPQTQVTVFDGWKKNSLYSTIDAAKNNQVYTVDQTIWSKFRGITSAELIAQEAIKDIYNK